MKTGIVLGKDETVHFEIERQGHLYDVQVGYDADLDRVHVTVSHGSIIFLEVGERFYDMIDAGL